MESVCVLGTHMFRRLAGELYVSPVLLGFSVAAEVQSAYWSEIFGVRNNWKENFGKETRFICLKVSEISVLGWQFQLFWPVVEQDIVAVGDSGRAHLLTHGSQEGESICIGEIPISSFLVPARPLDIAWLHTSV